MGAVLSLGKKIGYNEENTAIGTTSYIIEDKSANFIETIKEIADIPILSVKLNLGDSKIKGLQSFSNGFVKEGVGAGGCVIAAQMKIGIEIQKILELIEKEYQRVSTLQ